MVAGAYPAAVDEFALFDHADAEPGQVVVVAVVHAGHLGGLSANQRRAGDLAAAGDAADHGGGGGDIEPSAGVIVEEEQGFGALHHQVVGAHRHQVDADGVVLPELDRQTQLGADAVGGGHQYRLLHPGRELE